MEECESHRELQLRIGLDDDVGGLPARRPGRTVLGEQALVAHDLEVADCAERRRMVGASDRIDPIGREPLEPVRRGAPLVRGSGDHAATVGRDVADPQGA